MNTKKIAVCGLFVGLSFSAAGEASNTLSGTYVSSMYDYQDIATGSGFKLAFDHRMEHAPIRLEAAYIDTDADVDNSPFTLGYKGLNVSIGWVTPVSPGSDSFLWLKAGFYRGDAVVDGGNFGKVEDRASGLQYGLGADWMFTRAVGLRFEYEILVGMEDFADDNDLDLFNVGLVYSFGKDPERGVQSPRSSQTAAYSPPPPPPVPEQPATATSPPVEAPVPVVPATPPPPAPKFLAGETAMAMPGAMLRSRPAADGQSILALNSGAPVVLRSDVKNVTGTWWYVEAAGQRGWLNETDLQPKMP